MASSKMLEGYCADIEHLLREGSLRQAVRLAVALPDICATLESEGMESSRADYVRWCATWLRREQRDGKAVIGERLFRVQARATRKGNGPHTPSTPTQSLLKLRMRRNARTYHSLGRTRVSHPHNGLEAFQVTLCEELLQAAREWYREQGRNDVTVQTNLGKLLQTR
jgi:hypothetical protein